MKDLKVEIIEKTGEVYKENIENLTIPTSRSIGNNIGLMFDGVFGWLGVWGEKQKNYTKEIYRRF